ncbi:hypothetical protein HQ576_11735, partial [bacterium]|nr:hypothetical protein [bacterium]
LLRGVKRVCVSGEGVRAEIIKHYRPSRNLQKEQRDKLRSLLKELKEKHLARLKAKSTARVAPAPAKKPPKADTSKSQAKGKAAAEEEKEVKLPAHPLLRALESKSLRELYLVAEGFFNYAKFRMKQPNSQLAEVLLVRVTIERAAAPGDRELRLATPKGLTNPMCFQVGLLPEVDEQEPNDPSAPSELPKVAAASLPVLFNGQVMPGDVDRLRFRARRGQPLVIVTHARRLVPFLADAVPGWFQAVVALYDAKGNEVAFADDYRFDPDPVLFYKVPASGEYVLEIRDSIYRGREDFVYRVAIGELPFITQVFPLGGRAGARTAAAVDGWNLPRKRLLFDTQASDDCLREAALLHDRYLSNSVVYAVGDLPETTEEEPNNDPKNAQRITLPRIVNGRIGQPGDVDAYQFEGAKGDEVVAEVQARRLHSPLDSLVRLTDEAGRVVAWNDDYMVKDGHLHKDMGFLTHHADSYLIARLPASGVYTVRVADAQQHGSAAHGYRLRVSRPQPEFTLLVSPSSLSVPAGRTVAFTVNVLRKDGFKGEIELTLKGAPAGFAVSGRVPSGQDRARVTLTAPPKGFDHPVPIRLVGRGRAGGKTVSRTATPCDDVMQAFLWRHLAPARELAVAVAKNKWQPLGLARVERKPARVPAGGVAQVRIDMAWRGGRQVSLAPHEAPKGLSVGNVKVDAKGLTFDLKADGKAARAGLAGNLIVEVSASYQVKGKGKGKGKGGGKAAPQWR